MASTGTIGTVSSGSSGAGASAGSGSAGASGVGFGGTGAPSGDNSDAGDASEGAQDGAADGSGPPRQFKAPFDWVGILGTGQSLAVGGGPAINMSTTQPFKNIKLVDNGPDPKYPIDNTGNPQWATVPLVEPIRVRGPGSGPGYSDGQYPDNIEAETPHSGMANTLSTLWAARGLGDYVTAHAEFGWSGHCLADLNKQGGKRAYPASLHEAGVWKTLAAKANKSFGYAAIILTHGECDGGNPVYGAGIYQLWQDYNNDLKAITGQAQDIPMLVSQQSTINTGAAGSGVAVWLAGVTHPGQILCTGPKYQYQYLHDNLHLPAPGYERLGQKYAEVFDLVVNQKVAWKPLQPNKITRSGATITVGFDVPTPPLVWDSHVSPPHQQVNTEWAAGKGFEVTSGQGGKSAIVSTAIQGTNVIITLAADPGADKITVAYALTQDGGGSQGGTNQGMRGLLRDSDEFIGYDAETLDSQVTQGSAVVTASTAGGFIHRAGWDIVTGTDVPADTIVLTQDSNDQLTLSAPWPKASGRVKLSYRHDERNFCVHFSMKEP
jgi:hypothetical protein